MDNIGMFLTALKNASNAGNEKLDVPSSNMRIGLAKVLVSTGLIRSYKVANDGKSGLMRVYLKYDAKGLPMLTQITRKSTPGKRSYVRSTEIADVRGGFGVAILTTNRGIMTGDDAKKSNLGGELICTIW